MTRAGLTIVEVLVALALFAVLTAAIFAVWSSALRMTALAHAAAARAEALEPYSLPAALAARPPAACTAGPSEPSAAAGGLGGLVGRAGSPCLAGIVRCEPTAAALLCGGGGSLARIDLRLPATSGSAGAGASAVGEIRVWARVPP